MSVPHDHIPEFIEECTLQWLGEVVRYHHLRGAIYYVYIVFSDSIFYEEEPNIDVPGLLAARHDAVLLEAYGTCVILVEIISLHGISLRLNEELEPYGKW